MENVLFYLLIILCLGLIVTTAVYMNKYNNMKMLFEAADKTNDNLLQERMTLQKQIAEDEYQLSKIDSLAKQFSAKLTEVSEQNTDLIYKCDKQAAEIESLQSILKNNIEEQKEISDSINKQLAESYTTKAELIQKCDKQAAEINSLESINKSLLADNRKLADQISNTIPDKMETKTKRHK